MSKRNPLHWRIAKQSSNRRVTADLTYELPDVNSSHCGAKRLHAEQLCSSRVSREASFRPSVKRDVDIRQEIHSNVVLSAARPVPRDCRAHDE